MRNIVHNKAAERIEIFDQRFYTNDRISFFPGVTTILDAYPKGPWYEKWLKEKGDDADRIRDEAGQFGSRVHQATEDLDHGSDLSWADFDGKPNFTLEEWQCVLNYTDFKAKLQPHILANERVLCSEVRRFGGTLDRVMKFWDRRWLIDIKTSNQISDSYLLQLSAYAMLWNEFHPDIPIEQVAVLWLKSSIRTDKLDQKKELAQGRFPYASKGWQLVTFDEPYQEAYKDFQHVHAIWERARVKNGGTKEFKPLNLIYPDRIKAA